MLKKLLTLLLVPLVSVGQSSLPDPSAATGFIYQNPVILNDSEVADLNTMLLSLAKTDSVQMVVIIIDHIPAGKSIDDFALDIAKFWHIGQYGAVYILALKDNIQRLEITEHLAEIIPDISAKELVSNAASFYRHNQWSAGIISIIVSMHVLTRAKKIESFSAVSSPAARNNDWGTALILILLFILIVIVMTKLIHGRKKHETEAPNKPIGMPFDDGHLSGYGPTHWVNGIPYYRHNALPPAEDNAMLYKEPARIPPCKLSRNDDSANPT